MKQKQIIVSILLLAFLFSKGQQRVFVDLQVNQSKKITVYHDEPLIISVSLSNPDASYDAQWNREADQWLLQLDESYRKGELPVEKYHSEQQRIKQSKKIYTAPVIGSSKKPAIDMFGFQWTTKHGALVEDIQLKLLANSTRDEQFIVDVDAFYRLQWGISPSTMKTIKPGKYFLVCSVDGFYSDKAEVTILPAPTPLAELKKEATQLKLGRFELLNGQEELAMSRARQILQQNPGSVEGLVLLGDANLQKGNYTAALKNFESALQNFYKQYPASSEPPEYIIAMIETLKGK